MFKMPDFNEAKMVFLVDFCIWTSKVNVVKKVFGEDDILEKKLEITRPISFTLTKSGEKTGINFFPKLDDATENKLEASKDYKGWSF